MSEAAGHPFGTAWGVGLLMAGASASMAAAVAAVAHHVHLLLAIVIMLVGYLLTILLVLALGSVLRAARKLAAPKSAAP